MVEAGTRNIQLRLLGSRRAYADNLLSQERRWVGRSLIRSSSSLPLSQSSGMHADQIATFVRTVPVFHFLQPEHLERLASEVSIRELSDGDELLSRGVESSELFIMVQGEASATTGGENQNSERELRNFYPGDYFGMLNVLTRECSAATVRATDSGKAIVVTRSTIDKLFQESPPFAQAVCRSLASFLRENIIRIPAIPFEKLASYQLDPNTQLLPHRIAEYCQALVVEHDDSRAKVAIVNPGDTRACEFIKDVLKKYEVEFVAISAEDFQRHAPTVLGSDVVELTGDQPYSELAFVDVNGQRAPIAETDEHDVLVNALGTAIRAGVSDIHIEPSHAEGGRIRFRLDGKMLPFCEGLKDAAVRQLTSRLKVMASLDITNVRKPQDGRFTVVADDKKVEFRESVMPCQGGEKTVLRVIAPDNYLSFGNLFTSDMYRDFARQMFLQPSGLVLVTGPTGCGKTTTLYAALQMLNAEFNTSNIVTVEDPVEFDLKFATQTQVDNHVGFGFPTVLRSVLRQDPDIILVGEIRDRESAAIAVEAATTGHLVLSSLHTHSALETLARLRNLDVPSYLLADALKGIVSQKLVPRLHPEHREAISPDDPAMHRLRQRGILSEEESDTIYRGRSSSGGPDSGESGRIALFELLAVSNGLSELIERGLSRQELEHHLADNLYVPFERYAKDLLQGGYTSPEHIERVLPRPMHLNHA